MKIETRSGYKKICLKMGAKELLPNKNQGIDEKEGCELSVKSLSGSASLRVHILDLKIEDY